ncbi:MAG: PEP-CTERM sorting domain-containing protein [Anaerohalosphaeraceae bacterium]
MKRIYLSAVLMILDSAFAGPIINISDVQIIPETPSVYDIITINTQGYIPGGGIHYDKTLFSVNNFLLELNLYYTDRIGTAIPKPWSHLDVIGTLPQGNYDLLVQAYWRVGTSGYILHDDYSTAFQVIPEPATLSLLAFGAVLVRKRKGLIEYNKVLKIAPCLRYERVE